MFRRRHYGNFRCSPSARIGAGLIVSGRWGFGGLGLIPLLVGMPTGAVVAVAPAVGSVVGLFVHAWRRPFPSINAQSLAAAWGAGSASAILAGVILPQVGGDPLALLAVGAAFVLVSFLPARALTAWLLRYRKAREAVDPVP